MAVELRHGINEVTGSSEGDVLTGTSGNDLIHASAGSDTMYGGAGHDVFIAGAGNDYFQGDDGSDVYVWNLGDGNDTINDYSYGKNKYAGYNDTGVLRFGEGISPEGVESRRSGNDAVFVILETGETVTVSNWYSDVQSQLTGVEFSDGSVWTRDYINATNRLIRGTDGDDTIAGHAASDTYIAGDGNDTVYGGAGNDVFVAGKGNDYFQGDDGNDVYVWNLGDGNDTINDYSYGKNKYAGYNDTGVLRFGEGISPEDIELRRAGNNAVFYHKGTGEAVAVQSWFTDVQNQLTSVEFADGTIWTRANINAMSPILRGTDGDDTITGFAGQSNILAGGAGNDLLTGNTGNDIYVWSLGDGNDALNDYSANKSNGETGVLSLGAEVDPTLIALTRSGNDLVCAFEQSGEFITVQNWYTADYYQLTSMNFANGTTWTRANINDIASGTLAPFSIAP